MMFHVTFLAEQVHEVIVLVEAEDATKAKELVENHDWINVVDDEYVDDRGGIEIIEVRPAEGEDCAEDQHGS